MDREATIAFLKKAKPAIVVDAAAKVGGIGANNAFPVEFLADNLRIQSNLMEAAHAADVEKLIDRLGEESVAAANSAAINENARPFLLALAETAIRRSH